MTILLKLSDYLKLRFAVCTTFFCCCPPPKNKKLETSDLVGRLNWSSWEFSTAQVSAGLQASYSMPLLSLNGLCFMPSCPMPHHAPFTEKTKSFLQGRQLLTHRPATIGANTCQVDCLKMKTVTPSQIDRLIFADILEDFPRLHREIQQKLALQKVLASLWICNASSLVGATWAPDSPIKVISPNMCTIAPMVHSVHDICDLLPLLDLTSNHYI